jgi:sugar/nucleoside kinase (ribokinase family)
VVLKLGQDGAVAITSESSPRVPAIPVNVIDTTGAGDALAAGFLAEWIRTNDLNAALHAGVRTAARVIERVGAGPPPLVARD